MLIRVEAMQHIRCFVKDRGTGESNHHEGENVSKCESEECTSDNESKSCESTDRKDRAEKTKVASSNKDRRSDTVLSLNLFPRLEAPAADARRTTTA